MENDQIDIILAGKKDCLFESGPFSVPFTFNDEVVGVFDDMVSRSVLFIVKSTRHLFNGHICFIRTILQFMILAVQRVRHLSVATYLRYPTKLIGIDSSKAMLNSAQEKLKDIGPHTLELLHGDALDLKLSNVSFTVLNYTLQFVALKERKLLLKKIFDATVSEGILFMVKKCARKILLSRRDDRVYENFKMKSGYSKNEIERKKEALDNVLVPLSLDELVLMLKSVGFHHVEPIIRWNNFVTIIAQKNEESFYDLSKSGSYLDYLSQYGSELCEGEILQVRNLRMDQKKGDVLNLRDYLNELPDIAIM